MYIIIQANVIAFCSDFVLVYRFNTCSFVMVLMLILVWFCIPFCSFVCFHVAVVLEQYLLLLRLPFINEIETFGLLRILGELIFRLFMLCNKLSFVQFIGYFC